MKLNLPKAIYLGTFLVSTLIVSACVTNPTPPPAVIVAPSSDSHLYYHQGYYYYDPAFQHRYRGRVLVTPPQVTQVN